VKQEIRRVAMGRPASRIPTQLVYYLLGREFGVPPWVIADADAGDVLQAIQIFAILKEVENKKLATRAR